MASRLWSPYLSPSPRGPCSVTHDLVTRFSLRFLIQLTNRQASRQANSTGTGNRFPAKRGSWHPPLIPRLSTLSKPPPIPNTGQVKGLQAPRPRRYLCRHPATNCSLLVEQVHMCPGIDIQALRGTLPQPWSSSVPSLSSPEPDTVWSTEQNLGSSSASFDRVGLHLGCS